MKYKFILALLMVIASGYSFGVGSSCQDNNTVIENVTVWYNASYSEQLSTYKTCDYGCDTTYGRCKMIDGGFGALVLGAFMFFAGGMFALAFYFKPSGEDDYTTGKMGMSVIFVVIGMFAILGTLLFVAGIGSPIQNTSIQGGVDWTRTLMEVWGIIIGVFMLLLGVLFFSGAIRKLMGVEEGYEEE